MSTTTFNGLNNIFNTDPILSGLSNKGHTWKVRGIFLISIDCFKEIDNRSITIIF